MRKYEGNEPNGGDWIRLRAKKGSWHVYMDSSSGPNWINVKILSAIPVTKKANYWTAINWKESRVAMSRDAQNMKENRNSLFDFVCGEVTDEVCERMVSLRRK